jgi:cutinase
VKQYPADRTSDSVTLGAQDVVSRLRMQAVSCPDQKFALVGYSQGAMVMRQAVPAIPDDIAQEKVVSLVMFGDPGLKMRPNKTATAFSEVLQKKLWENCAVGDPVSPMIKRHGSLILIWLTGVH